MKKSFKFSVVFLIAISLIFAFGSASAEQKFPNSRIVIVVHPKPGGGSDILARQIAKASEDLFQQPVVVENKVGGSGAVASAYVSSAKPDGHTLYCVTPTQLITPLVRNLPINYTNFRPIVRAMLDPLIIYVRSESPFKNINDLIEHARKNPGKQNWSTGSAGSFDQMAALLFQKATNTKVTAVPFESGSDARVATLGGHVEVGIDEVGGISSQLEAGKVRILALFGEKRHEKVSDVPTLKELGYDVVVVKWRGIWAPKDVPDNVTEILEKTLQKAMEKPSFLKYLTDGGSSPAFMGSAEFTKFVESEHKKLEAFYKEIGMIK